MLIANTLINASSPPYIIAEIGVNHDGSTQRAIELVDVAADAGAQAIKLQFFTTNLLMSKAAVLAAYQQAAGESNPIAMLRRLELSIPDMQQIVKHAHARNIHAIVTVFSQDLIKPALTLGADAFKTASPDIIHKPLLDQLAGTGLPLIVSTGAATLSEVRDALIWLAPAADRLALLQCVSCYPTPQEHAALTGIPALQAIHLGPTGYSDHTFSLDTGALAVAHGAAILEKHITHNTAAPGPDHAASLMPHNLAQYIKQAQEAHTLRVRIAVDNPVKCVLDIEKDVHHASRQSLVATRDLHSGTVLAPSDITIKRPGTGISPAEFDLTIGKTIAAFIAADMPIMQQSLL